MSLWSKIKDSFNENKKNWRWWTALIVLFIPLTTWIFLAWFTDTLYTFAEWLHEKVYVLSTWVIRNLELMRKWVYKHE